MDVSGQGLRLVQGQGEAASCLEVAACGDGSEGWASC